MAKRRGGRERIDPSAGKTGGATYVRRDDQGQLTKEQDEIGKSISTDMRIDARHEAPKGQKDREATSAG